MMLSKTTNSNSYFLQNSKNKNPQLSMNPVSKPITELELELGKVKTMNLDILVNSNSIENTLSSQPWSYDQAFRFSHYFKIKNAERLQL